MRVGSLKNLFRLFKAEYNRYRWPIILIGILSFVGGALEGFGITGVIPIFSFVSKGRPESDDVVSQFIGRFFDMFGIHYTLKFLLIFIFSIFILKAIFVFVAGQVSAYITTIYEKRSKDELLNLILKSRWPYLATQKTGYLSQMLTTDMSNSSALLTYISTFIITAINLAIYILLVFNISPFIALLAIIFGVIIFFVIRPILYKNKVYSQATSVLYKDSSHYVDEVMIGAKAVKAMALETNAAAPGHEYFEKLRVLIMKTVFLKNLTTALLQPMGMGLIIAIFSYFYKTSAFNFASFAVIVYAINKVFNNVEMAQVQLNKMSTMTPYLAALVEYKERASKNAEVETGDQPFNFTSQLEFKNVSFAYQNDRSVLTSVNFHIKKGEMIGIIGPSGSGKTTITDLILRLYNPDQGQVLIDGQPVDKIKLSEWRRHIGYVSQDSYLINDTIENNIKFYNPNVSAQAVRAAAKTAHIDDFINQLPEKYNTVVGERGIKLSGGQRQRIVLARVLATAPQILILDEATSALDNESEIIIQEAISALKGSITVISVAHRLSTVLTSDRLIALEHGQIKEQGQPQELLKNPASYLARVYNLR